MGCCCPKQAKYEEFTNSNENDEVNPIRDQPAILPQYGSLSDDAPRGDLNSLMHGIIKSVEEKVVDAGANDVSILDQRDYLERAQFYLNKIKSYSVNFDQQPVLPKSTSGNQNLLSGTAPQWEDFNAIFSMKMTSEEINECPLCMDAFDYDDTRFFPCTCGYQICRFCWTKIINEENGLCPACRKPYNSENPASFNPLTEEEITKMKKDKKIKTQQKKTNLSESRKHLGEFRVAQPNLLFVVGIPIKLANDIELLKGPEYFGKYGKIFKVVCNMNTQFTGTTGPSVSAYVTYCQTVDAIRAIRGLRKKQIDGRTIKVSLGTTKYCSQFLKGLKCTKTDCMYLHDMAEHEISFTKQDMKSGKHTEYENKLIEKYHEELGVEAFSSEEANHHSSTHSSHQADKTTSKRSAAGNKSTTSCTTSKKTSSKQCNKHFTTSNTTKTTTTSISNSASSSQRRKKDSCSSTGSRDYDPHNPSVMKTGSQQTSSKVINKEAYQCSTTVGSSSDTGIGSSICDSSQGSASSTSSSAGGHAPIELCESVRPPQTQSAPHHQDCQPYENPCEKAFQNSTTFSQFGINPNSSVSLSSSCLEEELESHKNNLASSYHSGVSYSLNINNTQSNGHLPDNPNRLQSFKSSPSFYSDNYHEQSDFLNPTSPTTQSLELRNDPNHDADDDAKLDFDPILESQAALAQLLEAEEKPFSPFNQRYPPQYDNQMRKTIEQQYQHQQYIQQLQFNQRLQQQQYQQQLHNQMLSNLSAAASNSSESQQNKSGPAPPPGFEGVLPVQQSSSNYGPVSHVDINNTHQAPDPHLQQQSILNSLLSASGLSSGLPPDILLSQLGNPALTNKNNIAVNGSNNPTMSAASLANCLSQQMQLYSMASYLQQQPNQHQRMPLEALSGDALSQLMQSLSSQNATNYPMRHQSTNQQQMPTQSLSNDFHINSDQNFNGQHSNLNQPDCMDAGDIHHKLKSLLPHANISYGNNGLQRTGPPPMSSFDPSTRHQADVNYSKNNVDNSSWSFDDPAILVSGQLASSPNLREEFWNSNLLTGPYNQSNSSNQQQMQTGTPNGWSSGLSGVSMCNNQSNVDQLQGQATQHCNQPRL